MIARSGLVLRQVGDLTVVVPIGERVLDLNGLVTLNETGKFLWELLDGSHSQSDLVEAMLGEFDVDQAQAEKDVQAFLEEIRQIGLLEHESE